MCRRCDPSLIDVNGCRARVLGVEWLNVRQDPLLGLNPPDLPEPIVGPYMTFPLWLVIVVGLILFAIAATVLVFFLRKMNKNMPGRTQAAMHPRQEALSRLGQLSSQMSRMDSNVVAVEVTAIVKRFLERHYGVDLKSHTTGEYYDAIRMGKVQVPEELAQALANLFHFCDALKFQAPEESEQNKQHMMEQAAAIVNMRSPSEMQPSGTTGPQAANHPQSQRTLG